MVKTDFSKIERTALVGYSPLDSQSLALQVAAGVKPSQLPGDFTLIIEGETCDRLPYLSLVTSAVCATPYYVYHSHDQFVHGKNVFEVVSKAKISWQWDHQALNSLLFLSFPLGNDSLHQDVKRIDPATTYYFSQGQLTTIKDTFPTDIFTSGDRISPNDALKIYNDVCDQYYANSETCLSLSGGYDSRVLLASLLKRGIKPIVGTEGDPNSHDVQTASAIAKDLALEHRIIQINATDYPKYAAKIVEATSGELLLSGAWGSFLFLQQVEFPYKSLHLAGANGELYRTFYFDKGILCHLADFCPSFLLKQFFQSYLQYKQRQYSDFPREAFAWNQQPLNSDSIGDRCYQLSSQIPSNFSNRLDYFYTFYRVRNYIAKGLALYNLINPTSSPFLDYRVVMAGTKLNRKYKLNNFFHQQILLDSYPQLLNYPVNGTEITPKLTPNSFYWLKQKPKEVAIGKSLNSQLMENSQLINICYDSPHLDQFMAKKYREMTIENQCFDSFSFLVTMHFISEKIASI